MREEVVVVEFVGAKFLLQFLRLLLIDFRGGLFDKRDHVAHAEDPAGHAFRIEDLKAVELFPETDEFDRAPGDFADRQRGAAAGVTIELGQNESGQVERLVEVLRNRDRLLTERGIRDQQNFIRLHRLPDADQFLNHVLIDLQPSRGVDDHHVNSFGASLFDRVEGDCGDVDAGPFRMDRNVDFPADDFELIDRGRPVDVTGDQQHFLAVAPEFQGKFSRGCGLAAAVESDHHDDRWPALHVEFGNAASEQLDQFVVDDFDHLLAGRDALDHLLADTLGPDSFDELGRDLHVDIRLQEREPDFAHGFRDIGFGERALPAQFAEYIVQFVT